MSRFALHYLVWMVAFQKIDTVLKKLLSFYVITNVVKIFKAFLEISNLTATPRSNATFSYISVTFNGTPAWQNNPEYVTNYVIRVTNLATGFAENVTTNDVNAPDFLVRII